MRSVGVAAVLAACSAAASVDDCQRLEFTDRDAAEACFRGLSNDPVATVRAEAAWALDDIAAANAEFRAAVSANPQDAGVRARWGELFLEARAVDEAQTLFREALDIDALHTPAKLGLARLALAGFDARAEALVDEVLAIDPANNAARLLLAELALEAGDTARAQSELEGPLGAAEPAIRLRAFALSAAVDHLAGVVPSPWEARAMALHSGYGELFETVAHFYIITRRYREAITQLERAVALAPTLWRAYGTLGMNLLRVNRFDEARRMLARAHDGNPYNAQVVNTLRLLDEVLADWPALAEEGLVLRIAPDESDALTAYVQALTANALAVIGERYAYRPDRPVVVELYRRHEDFAVRTAGVPGIGILGATFGEVVVMDGPSARGIDDGFDWASALWHEIAHVVTLGATNNRVARWFSEGVSVLEEWRTGPSRFQVVDAPEGRRAVPLNVIDAHREGNLLPVADLDEGFIRPQYRGQVGVSYTQAGLLCEYLAAAHGGEALVRLLAAYRNGDDTSAAIGTALDITPAALDAAFASHLDERFDGIDTGAFLAASAQAHGAAVAGNWPAAAGAAGQAIASYPYFVDPGSPYPTLAEAQDRRGDRAAAVAALRTYWQAGGRLTAPLTQLVQWLADAGHSEEALAVRRDLALVAPFNKDFRAELGDLLLANGLAGEAVDEYLAYQSLRPHDVADAHYRLARAYFGIDDIAAARRQTLLALEIAPSYGAALDLLVEINP